MRISELPQKVREKALEYQRNETSDSYSKKTDDLHDAFDWWKTDEGCDYWDDFYIKQERYE